LPPILSAITYATALGTVSVRDEITVEISVVALPRARSASARF
jgi:hypothetical protein